MKPKDPICNFFTILEDNKKKKKKKKKNSAKRKDCNIEVNAKTKMHRAKKARKY